MRNHAHPIPNEFLGGRGDATTALVEADNHIDVATSSGIDSRSPANVGDSCRASAASSARAEPAAERAIAKKTVRRAVCAIATGVWPALAALCLHEPRRRSAARPQAPTLLIRLTFRKLEPLPCAR